MTKKNLSNKDILEENSKIVDKWPAWKFSREVRAEMERLDPQTTRFTTIIHVNQHKIKSKSKKPLTVKTYNSNQEASRVRLTGPSDVVYSPDKPLSCGAKCWIETKFEVEILD